MASICLTTNMNTNLNENLLKSCFDILKHNKEQSKHGLMVEQLNGDMTPAIVKL